MSAKINDIKDAVITRINALGVVQAIYEYPELQPSGWPVAWVIDTTLDGRFIDTANNRRVYSVEVTVAYDLGQTYEANQQDNPSWPREKWVERTLAEVVDDIINDLDENFTLDGTTILFIDAADYRKGDITLPQGTARAVSVTLLINTDFEV